MDWTGPDGGEPVYCNFFNFCYHCRYVLPKVPQLTKIMSNALRFRLFAVFFLLVLMNTSLFAQLFRNLPRRVERQPVVTPQRVERQPVVAPQRAERQPAVAPQRVGRQPAVTTISPAEAKVQLQRLTSEIKENPRKITENDLNRSQRLLLDAVNDLQRRLPREFDRETANDWSTTFQLAELRTTLGTPTPDAAILEAVQNAFFSDKEGIRWLLFDGLHTALRRYQTVARLITEESYERQLNSVCDNLVNHIEAYSEARNPLYFVTLSEAITWLDDISFIEPRAARLAELTRAAFSGVNLRLQIGNEFIAAGFRNEIEETLDIDDVILGTRVIGDGTLTGRSTAELVHSPNRAIIKVLAEGEIETLTDGSQRMVTVKNHTTGILRGEKQILFSADGITTTPASARANLNAQISDINVNAGRLVQRIARNQVDSRKAESEAEAARRAERQMTAQMNDRIDPNIAELNAKYQKIREALNKPGLFPRVWNLSSSPQQIDWSILLGNRYQPSAPIPAPTIPATNGLAVQVHQSALNNMLTIALAGRSIDEEKFVQRLEEFFDETPAFLERKTDAAPARVSFGPRAPVDVLFIDNKIRVVVRLNDIQVGDNSSRSFRISVEYQIKMEEQEGRSVVVLEQTEAEAYPLDWRPGGGRTLSATETIIRTYLLRRLEALPKRQEAKSLDLGGEWAGSGQLVPQFASAEKGWLTLVWSWKPAE